MDGVQARASTDPLKLAVLYHLSTIGYPLVVLLVNLAIVHLVSVILNCLQEAPYLPELGNDEGFLHNTTQAFCSGVPSEETGKCNKVVAPVVTKARATKERLESSYLAFVHSASSTLIYKHRRRAASVASFGNI